MASQAYIRFCESVKDKTDIVELVQELGGKPKPAGRHQMVCCSPLRSEKDPSFRIYVAQNSWYDFGAQKGGDVIDLVKAVEGVEFNDAIDILAKRVGMEWKSNGSGKRLDEETEKAMVRYVERRWVEKLSTDAATYYHSKLTPKIRAWLKKYYGFDDDIIDRQRIGWADGSLLEHMHRTCGHQIADLLKTGLFIRTQGGKIIEHHELRVTFPYWRGDAAPYMISRRIDGVTPDTSYQKSKYKKTLVKSDNHPYVSRHVRNDILYGEDSTKRHQRILIITEGVTDAITAIYCGWAVISPVTVRFKADDIERVLKLSGNADIIVIINDNEMPRAHDRTGKMIQPGFDGAEDMAKVLFEAGRDVRIGILPRPETEDKVDLNSFVRDHGKDALTPIIDEALPYPEFLLWRVPKDTRPAELDGALAPVYEAIAHTDSALEREAYVNSICKRFGLSQQTVQDAVDEFIRTRGPLPAPPALPASSGGSGAAEPPSSSGGSSGSNGASSGPPTIPPGAGQIRGAVWQSEDNHYFTIVRDKETGDFVEDRISNFVLVPKRFVQLDHGRQYCCDIHSKKGPVYKDVIFPPDVFRSSRDFRTAVGRNGPLTWAGSDNNVQGVIELLGAEDVPIHQGVEMVGYIKAKEGERFVTSDRVIDSNGTRHDTELVFAAIDEPSIAKKLNLDGADMPETTIAKLARRAIPKVCDLNEPYIICALIGWFWASCVSTQVRAELHHFPLLVTYGTQGSGKSSIICDIFWQLVGVVGEPFSCSDTRFALLRTASSTSSVAIVFDEYRDLAPRDKDYFNRILRENYMGGEMQRGRPDQRLNRFRVTSPMVVIGEQQPDDPALFERMVCASPRKDQLTPAGARAMRQLLAEPLYQLGGHLHRWCLGLNVPEMIERARAQLHAKLLPLLSQPLPPRVHDNMLVVVLGNMMFDRWCEDLGVKLTNRPNLQACFPQIVGAITDSESGGGVKDIFDRFLESCSAYAHIGLLEEGVHYALIDGKLCMHLPSCYAVYLQQRRREGNPDGTHGQNALRRVIKEKYASGDSYIADESKRVRLGGRQVRCLVIDQSKIPDSLDVDEFPLTTNRVKGHHLPFDNRF
jgi:DNA primase